MENVETWTDDVAVIVGVATLAGLGGVEGAMKGSMVLWIGMFIWDGKEGGRVDHSVRYSFLFRRQTVLSYGVLLS
jgi:hypothetical protein